MIELADVRAQLDLETAVPIVALFLIALVIGLPIIDEWRDSRWDRGRR